MSDLTIIRLPQHDRTSRYQLVMPYSWLVERNRGLVLRLKICWAMLKLCWKETEAL